jgi:hypothetical protein
MQERAAQVKVIVAVYYETEEGREFVGDVARKLRRVTSPVNGAKLHP